MSSNKTSGRFSAVAFAASLAFGFSFALATDAPAKSDKPAAQGAQGVVAEKAIHAHGGGDCAKAMDDCPKEAKADCCPKGAKGAKGAKGMKDAKDDKGAGHHGTHEHKHKGADEAKASPAGAADKPADKPEAKDKGASHPG